MYTGNDERVRPAANDLDRDYVLGALADEVYPTAEAAQQAIDQMEPWPSLDDEFDYFPVEEGK
tara:strand:+ start:1033 stop:1221 length:189 start_codon:yes stop_codon:yes gene_type:complete